MHYYITLLRLLFTLFLFQLQSKPILLPADKRAPWKWLAGSRSQLKYRNPPERTRIANRFSNKLTASCGRNSRTLVWCQQCPGGIPKCQIYCNLSPQQKKNMDIMQAKTRIYSDHHVVSLQTDICSQATNSSWEKCNCAKISDKQISSPRDACITFQGNQLSTIEFPTFRPKFSE